MLTWSSPILGRDDFDPDILRSSDGPIFEFLNDLLSIIILAPDLKVLFDLKFYGLVITYIACP